MITLGLNEKSKQKSKKSKGKMITKEDELGEERGISVEGIRALGDKSLKGTQSTQPITFT